MKRVWGYATMVSSESFCEFFVDRNCADNYLKAIGVSFDLLKVFAWGATGPFSIKAFLLEYKMFALYHSSMRRVLREPNGYKDFVKAWRTLQYLRYACFFPFEL